MLSCYRIDASTTVFKTLIFFLWEIIKDNERGRAFKDKDLFRSLIR